MFDNRTMLNSDKCGTCCGHRTLRVVILDRYGKNYKELSEVKCPVCDGKGVFETAASQAGKYQKQNASL